MYIKRRLKGFTIVELVIVIAVIGILAAITVAAFNGIQSRARNAESQSTINGLAKQIEVYNIRQGSYPSTGGLSVGRTDDNCIIGTSQTDWIPNIPNLPQSNPPYDGAQDPVGCYIYASDGANYVLSAWNMVDKPQTDSMYRRVGFRETRTATELTQLYICNHTAIGGTTGGVYDENRDMYKHSYTMSSIQTCNETPPAGA